LFFYREIHSYGMFGNDRNETHRLQIGASGETVLKEQLTTKNTK